MNYREILPALSSIVITIILLAGIALSDLDLSGGDGVKAQYQGFEGISSGSIEPNRPQSVSLNAIGEVIQ